MRAILALVALAACSAPSPADAGFTAPVAVFAQSPPSTPRIDSLSPSSGQVGDFVSLNGVRFGGVTAVSFNGTAASFSYVDAGHVIATVPGGATTGTVSITTASGSDTGPSFTVTANTFAFNLDSDTLPSGLTGTRTGDTIYCARTLGTEAVAVAGASIYEQREDMSGQWTFPAFQNMLTDPFDFDTGWTKSSTAPTFTTGQNDPTGGTGAVKVTDGTAGIVATTRSPDNGGSGHDPTVSIWVRDDVGDPPTGQGALGASEGGGGFPRIFCGSLTCEGFDSGTGWRRRHSKYSTSGSPQVPRILFSPAGQTPVYNAYATQDAAQTGARIFWGAQAMAGSAAGYPGFDAPLVDGSSSLRVLAVDAGLLDDVQDGNGDLDIEGRFYLPDIVGSQTGSEVRIVSIESAEGVTRLSLKNSISVLGQWKSGSEVGTSISYGRQGQLIEWRLWTKPTENSYGWAIRYNGAIAYVQAAASPGAALTTPTAVVLGGHQDGAQMILPAMHTLFRASRRAIATVYDAEGVMLGDSTTAAYSGTSALVGGWIYTAAEASSRLGILSLATTAETCVQQLARWQASSARGNSDVAWVSIACGINDINGGASAATVRTRIQNIVDDINTNNPTAAVLLIPMTPAAGTFDAGELIIWDAVNDSIIGGASPITGSNLVRGSIWTELENGSTGALKSQYDTGDGIHENDAARLYMAGVYRALLVANGLL
jgi:lysophospholipase L1-like esterase